MLDALEHYHERAAIAEHNGGLDQAEAEALALGDVAIAHGWPSAIAVTVELMSGKEADRPDSVDRQATD